MKILSTLPSEIKHVVTDSRRVTDRDVARGDTAFVALRTAMGDGHLYVKSLYRRGLRTFVVNDVNAFSDMDDATFVVAPDDTLHLLIRIAGMRLKESRAQQILVTGSCKKTTVKELITKTLRNAGVRTSRSPRTWNSAMGAALSIIENTADDPEVIVTEIGIDAPGQAKRIAPMLSPEIGVITPITAEHDESFENHSAKVAEKIALVRNARRIVYMDSDDDLSKQIAALHHPDVVAVDSLDQLVEVVTGHPCADIDVSTRIEVRQIPDGGTLFIDSFTNDIDSLPLSLDLAAQRQAGRRMTIFLGDFDGDKEKAVGIASQRGTEVHFFDRNDPGFLAGLHRSDYVNSLVVLKGSTQWIETYFDEARHDTTLQVDLDALVHNYNVYRSFLPPNTGVIGMVKADAYGLGALEVAKTLQTYGASYLAVAVVDEGVALRRAGITMPIIVLNPITNRFEDLLTYSLEPTIFSIEELSRIEKMLKDRAEHPVPVHIKLDTGMHRVGFGEEEIEQLAECLKSSPLVEPKSIFSHLATADCPDMQEYTHGQIEKFERMSTRLIALLGRKIRRHILNTAGISTLGTTAASYDMARLGIGLYGVTPIDTAEVDLRPVARLVSTIISLKQRPSETSIGYGRVGMTHRDSIIATLPIGYADGIDRRHGNGNARFLVGSTLCPTIGNICMDMLMIDVTEAVAAGEDVRVGTEVEIFGPKVPLTELSDALGTIPYEILTSVSPRVRRTYHNR